MMDLVPILSTIILVATLATLVLAVIAYFLYKSRERKARSAAAQRRDTVVAMPVAAAAPEQHALVVPQVAMPTAQPAYAPTMAALPAAPAAPMYAADTNFDGRADTLYAPAAPAQAGYADPYAMPVAQAFTARTPASPQAMPQAMPQGAPVAPSSMFYEYTQGNLVPVDAAPAPTMAHLGVDPYAAQQAQLDAARAQAQQAEAAAEQQQQRLDQAQDRVDAARRRDDGLAWL